MHITGMTVKRGSHPAFANSQDIELTLDQQVNLFIGSNGCGKTSLLRVLAEAAPLDNNTIISFNQPEISISEDWNKRFENPTDSDSAYLDHFEADDGRLLVIPWVYIPATRIALPGEFDMGHRSFHDDSVGTYDLQTDLPYIDWTDNSQIFDNRRVETLVKKLFDHLKDGKPKFGQLLRMQRHAYRCAKEISKEIVTGSPINYVSNPSEILFTPDEIDSLAVEPYVHPGMGVSTIGSQSGGISLQYVGNLSAGTQGTYLWVLYIALKIAYHYRFEKGWEEKPAILLIDEIENHLHPTWQRRVIPALLEHFPKLQIFATTHSPFVVAGLKAGQVHLLKRDDNDRTTATTNEKDIVGWTMDEILRTMMGVEDPTDDATAAAAAELRQLRNEWPRSSPEEEEKRQERIAELRQKVDRDLLAGGPLAAQREDFERRFAEALEKHGIPKNLNLENG